MALFEEFSAGYYVARLYVAVHGGSHAVLARPQHEQANERIYATGEGVERTDHPLVMKVTDRHFPVLGNDDVPADTLAVPEAVLEPTAIDDPPTAREVLVAKAERAAQLLEWFTPYEVVEPDLS